MVCLAKHLGKNCCKLSLKTSYRHTCDRCWIILMRRSWWIAVMGFSTINSLIHHMMVRLMVTVVVFIIMALFFYDEQHNALSMFMG
jgi:hypothetical protein